MSRTDGSGTALNLSSGFAEFPQWSEDGRYYFQVTFQGAVQRFNVTTSGTGIPFLAAFDEVAILGANPPYFDVFSDGQRAIVGGLVTRNSLSGTDSTVASSFPLHFIFNWFEELK